MSTQLPLLLTLSFICCLQSQLVHAQNTAVIGKARSYIESNYLPSSNYRFQNEERNGDLDCYWYNDPTTTREDIKKNLGIFYKDDVCTTSMTVTLYDNLKLVMAYMDDHYKKVTKNGWTTLDGKYFMMLFTDPEHNNIRVLTQLRQVEQ